jgi:hypothetical protein
MTKIVDSVEIQAIELNSKDQMVIGRFSSNQPQVKLLIDAIKGCNTREIVKFRPKYKVTIGYSDNSAETFLILDGFVKIEGLPYRCSTNLESLIDAIRRETGR